MSETNNLVLSAPMMAAPLNAGQDSMHAIRLSMVEAGAPLPDRKPENDVQEISRTAGLGVLANGAYVAGTLATPSLDTSPASLSSRAEEGDYVRLTSALEPTATDEPKASAVATTEQHCWLGSKAGIAIVAEIQFMVRMRRARAMFFDETLFADPAWDIMLDLMEARLRGAKVTISSLCMAASVPATTAIRWIKNMTEKGVLVREPDAVDKRRVYVTLSDATAAAMMDWFNLVGHHRSSTDL